VTWAGWRIPTIVEAALILAIGLVLLGGAVAQFSRSD